MKARPRRAEGEIAKRLSLFYSQWGASPVQRIPILGRRGPDIQVNELKWAVDVKSRLHVPRSMLVPPGKIGVFRAESCLMVGAALCSLDLLRCEISEELLAPAAGSKTVLGWLLHMKEWADANACTAAVVLHKPKLEYAKSTFIILQKDWRHLWQEIK